MFGAHEQLRVAPAWFVEKPSHIRRCHYIMRKQIIAKSDAWILPKLARDAKQAVRELA